MSALSEPIAIALLNLLSHFKFPRNKGILEERAEKTISAVESIAPCVLRLCTKV